MKIEILTSKSLNAKIVLSIFDVVSPPGLRPGSCINVGIMIIEALRETGSLRDCGFFETTQKTFTGLLCF